MLISVIPKCTLTRNIAFLDFALFLKTDAKEFNASTNYLSSTIR